MSSRRNSSGSLRPKHMGEATGRQSGALYGLSSFRRSSSGSLAEFAAVRRASDAGKVDREAASRSSTDGCALP